MLETTRHNYRLISIFISTLAAGLPLWTSDIRQIDFTDYSFLIIWLFVGFVASFVVQFVVNLKPRDIIGSFAIGYVTAVVIHFVSTILINSYIQTRFELSLLMALIVGILAGWLGTLMWRGVKTTKKKKK
jgi:uncharacterized membrane protein YeaQ/YmgE (transglycosylase-associated protein family)